jgi:Mrp family chromosome partitioning ATPase
MTQRQRLRGLIRDPGTQVVLARALGNVLEQIAQLLPDQATRSCTVVSPQARDGRTTLTINLAGLAGEATRPAVLIDADALAPRVHELFGVARGPGLTDVLSGAVPLRDALRPSPDNPAVHLLTAGEAAWRPGQLGDPPGLAAMLAELRQRYAWIFVDTAPLLARPGAAALARCTDGAILAVRYGRTRGPLVMQSLALLRDGQAVVLGAVLTQRRFTIPSYVYRRL